MVDSMTPRPVSFFLAGTMQGASPGAALVDQGYRTELHKTIIQHYPNAVVHCPLKIMRQRFGHDERLLQEMHSTLASMTRITPADLPPRLRDVFKTFHDLLQLVADSSVLIVYLPNHEPSMGTAMEMLQAYRHRRLIISITDMKQNLAVLSTSNIILPDVGQFAALLSSHWLEANGLK